MDMLANTESAAANLQENTMPSTEPLLKFSDVSKSFGRSTVLQNISLNIHPQDRIALVGSNGAGKTTLFRCLLGEYKHQTSIPSQNQREHQHRQNSLCIQYQHNRRTDLKILSLQKS